MDRKPNIAIYVQHYLAPSMTFIYRQLRGIETDFHPIVFCSDQKENLDKFPFNPIYHRQRNFIQFKKSKYYKKIFGSHTLLNTNPKLSPNQKKYFSNLIDKNDIKLIHAHFGPSGIEILPLAQQKKIPLVVTFHGYDASILFTMEQYTRNIKKVFEYAKIIVVSHVMKDELIKHGANEKNISVIRCGIPTKKFKPSVRETLKEKFQNRKEIIFLQISNFVEVKGHKYTIEAFKQFLKIYPAARLILAGDGPLRNSLIELSRELKIINSVEFPGIVDENTVVKMMEEADVFLHHSVSLSNGVKEGLPTVLMEAMASGMTVIASAHSAIPELILDGVNGFLVAEKDTDEYFNTLFNLRNSTQDICKNARETILKSFSLSITTDKLRKLYFHLIEG